MNKSNIHPGAIDPEEFMDFMYQVLAPCTEKYSGDEIEGILRQILDMVPTGSAYREEKTYFLGIPVGVLWGVGS